MSVFAIIAPEPNDQLEAAVKQHFGEDDHSYKIAPGQFLVSTDRMTTKAVAEALGLFQGSVGRAMVLRLGNYTGWHSKDMWEWIDSQAKLTPPASKVDPIDE